MSQKNCSRSVVEALKLRLEDALLPAADAYSVLRESP